MSENRILKIRWATWWPVPYWTERFNVLANKEGVDLEVVFLSSASELLPTESNRRTWKFRYKVIRDERAVSGYHEVNRRLPRPLPLVQGDFDLLIMPYGDPEYVAAGFICTAIRKKYCIFCPNNDYDLRPSSLFRERLKYYLYRHAEGVLATGPSQRAYASKYLKAPHNIHVIGNPAPPLTKLRELRQDVGRESIREQLGWGNEFVILYVGRLSREKGLYTLIRALECLSVQEIIVRTVLVGSGPCEENLKSMVNDKKLNIQFLGFLEGVDLTRIYVAADIFVLPSLSEAWGLVVNEAMEAGLPVVISDKVGAQQALVRHMGNGRVFQAGNVSSLAENIMELYRNRTKSGEMSTNSMEIIRSHTIDAWADEVKGAIEMLLDK